MKLNRGFNVLDSQRRPSLKRHWPSKYSIYTSTLRLSHRTGLRHVNTVGIGIEPCQLYTRQLQKK